MTDIPDLPLNDGRQMPQLGLGVFKVPAEQAQANVATALDLGYRAVDTARLYNNEEGVGAAVRASDATVFVTTKLWVSDFGADATRRAFDESFARLGLDWLDLYLLHWPDPKRDLYVETWKTLVALRDEGRIRSIGVSNFEPDHLERIIDATGVVPATNQIELHPHFQQVELRAWHEANDIVTTSWSPLGQGGALSDPVIVEIAAKHGRSPAQVIIRWHLDLGLAVIPKASSAERQRDNLDALTFRLDEEDMRRIATLDRADGRIGPHPEDLTA